MPIPFRKTRACSLLGRCAPLGVLALGVLLTALAWRATSVTYRSRNAARFSMQVDLAVEKIEDLMRDWRQVLTMARLLYASSESVEPNEWAAFVSGLELGRTCHGVSRVLFLEPERSLSAPDSAGGDGSQFDAPATRQPQLIARYVSPAWEEGPEGFRSYRAAEPLLSQALLRACDGNQVVAVCTPALSGALGQPSVLIALPIYHNGAVAGDVRQRRAALTGWVVAEAAPGQIVREAADRLKDEVRLVVSASHCEGAAILGDTAPAGIASTEPHLRRSFDLAVADTVWTLSFAALPRFEPHRGAWSEWSVLIGGLAITLLAARLVCQARERRRSAETLAAQMTQSLRASEAEARKLALVASYTHSAVSIMDAAGRIEWINAGFTRLTGLTLPEVIGRSLRDLRHAEDNPATAIEIDSCLARGEAFSGEVPGVLRHGQPAFILLEIIPILDAEGRTTCFISVESDITERRRAEEQTRLREKQYRDVFDATTDGLVVMDDRGQIVDANVAAGRMYGYERDELVGLSGAALAPKEVSNARFERFLQEAAVAGCHWESQHVRRDGQVFDVEIRGVPLLFQGRPHILAVFTDITQRKAAEERQREYAAQLESANRYLEEYSFAAQAATRAKSELLANMSHELRTPLTAILGFAEILRTEGDITKAPPGRIEAIDTIIRNGEYLLRLINDVLDLSKIEAGRFEIETAVCAPAEIVAEVQRLVEIRARAKQLPFHVEYLGTVPERLVTDATRVRQILINLAGNAIKFTERGEVKLTIRYLRAGDGQAKLEFCVSDTGIGMTGEQLARAFEPFVQVHRSLAGCQAGTGLGLAISRRLTELLEGTIEAESTQGAGSTFRLTIPVGTVAGAAEWSPLSASQPAPPLPLAEAPRGFVRLPLPARILVADDGADNRRLVSVLLHKAGAEVTVVDDGRAAVTAAATAAEEGRAFDVILMDMQMPVLDGYAATRELRARGYALPIIALTAHAMKEDRARCLAVGCDDYATKPIQRSELLALISRHVVLARVAKHPPRSATAQEAVRAETEDARDDASATTAEEGSPCQAPCAAALSSSSPTEPVPPTSGLPSSS